MLPQATATAALPNRPRFIRWGVIGPWPEGGGSSPNWRLLSGCRGKLRARLLHQVGQQAEIARALDRPRQLALLLGRDSGDPARYDLAALRHEALQQPHVLVVDL